MKIKKNNETNSGISNYCNYSHGNIYVRYPVISVLICTYNDSRYLKKCIFSILNQTYHNFELIIIDDGSTDNTKKIISTFNDSRINYIRLTKNTGSIGKTRSIAVKHARGRYCFFIDGDCYAHNNWLKTGLDAFKKFDAISIEGRIIYVSESYQSTLSDKGGSNDTGACWMTGNMAFKTYYIKRNNFNPNLTSLEDRELGLRINQICPIPFISESKVYHMKKQRYSILSYLKEAERYRVKIQLIKYNNDTAGNIFRIVNPKFLLILFLPFLILAEFYYGRIKSWDDFKILPFVWIKAIYIRYIVWSTAIKERVFVI